MEGKAARVAARELGNERVSNLRTIRSGGERWGAVLGPAALFINTGNPRTSSQKVSPLILPQIFRAQIDGDGGGATVHAQFRVDMLHVFFHCSLGALKDLADLPVRFPFRYPMQHLPLARAQARQSIDCKGDRVQGDSLITTGLRKRSFREKLKAAMWEGTSASRLRFRSRH